MRTVNETSKGHCPIEGGKVHSKSISLESTGNQVRWGRIVLNFQTVFTKPRVESMTWTEDPGKCVCLQQSQGQTVWSTWCIIIITWIPQWSSFIMLVNSTYSGICPMTFQLISLIHESRKNRFISHRSSKRWIHKTECPCLHLEGEMNTSGPVTPVVLINSKQYSQHLLLKLQLGCWHPVRRPWWLS